jgi:hydroxypyruvate reductase
VIGGTASDVGSGPSVPDASTVASARRLLARFAPAFRDVPLVRTFSPATASRARGRAATSAKIVISPEELARAMASLMGETLPVRLLPPSQAPIEALAAEYVALAERTRGPRVYVRAAEPAVAVAAAVVQHRGARDRGRGRGGRSTHLAALVGQRLGELRLTDASSRASKGVLFAALASDGVDGSSGTGGAIIDHRFASRVARVLGDEALARSLERFDTGPLHQALHTAVPMRPTGHNLADVHVLVVE